MDTPIIYTYKLTKDGQYSDLVNPLHCYYIAQYCGVVKLIDVGESPISVMGYGQMEIHFQPYEFWGEILHGHLRYY